MLVNNTLVKAIKDYILSDEDKEEIINELNRYKKEFSSVLDYNWYMYGNILPYYSDIREFYNKNGFTCNDNDNDNDNDNNNNDELLYHFRFHIRRAIDSILEENK